MRYETDRVSSGTIPIPNRRSFTLETFEAQIRMNGIALVVALSFGMQQPTMTADQFSKLIHAQHEIIRDFSMTYEGEMVWTGPPDILKKPVDQFGQSFQGFDFFRTQDGAELTEVYSSPRTVPATVYIRKKAYLKGKLETLTLSPDQKKVNLGVGIVTSKGGPGSLSGPNSPHVLIYHWYFTNMESPDEKGYRFDGWETIDDHPCVRVQFNTGRESGVSAKNFQRFWIDMDRGGHPLRVETYRNGKLSGRIDSIELREHSRENASAIWFPISAVLEGFEWDESFYSKPVMRETIAVVNGSVRINQGLDDAVFKIPPPGRMAAPEVARREREGAGLPLADRFEKTDPTPMGRTDPASVRDALQKQLAEADLQAKGLESPSEIRNPGWSGPVVAQAALGLTGLVLLGLGYWWRRRS